MTVYGCWVTHALWDSCCWYIACGWLLACHWSSPTHNSTSEFLQLTSSPSCCRTLATSFRPPRSLHPLPISYYLLAAPSLHTPLQTACLPASGGSPARGGWVTLSHQLHCLHPGKLHRNMNLASECDMKTKYWREGLMKVTGGKHEHRTETML